MVVSMGGCRWWESHQYLPWEQTTNFPTIHDQQIQDQLKTISKTVRTKAYIQAWWILKIENRTCIVDYSFIILLEFHYCEVLYASPPQLRARTSNCVVWVSKSLFVSGSKRYRPAKFFVCSKTLSCSRNGARCISCTSFGPKSVPRTKFWGKMVKEPHH